MPTLSIVNFNIVCATLGGFITLFGLVSYLLKEKFYLSEVLISTFAGLVFSPHATNLVKPLAYANYNEENLEQITLYFCRLVLGVQLVLAGVQLPSKYLWKEWKSLSILLGPGMCVMWICTSLLVWAMVPDINILVALSVGACVTPTDPVLSNSIVKGKFADKNIPPPLQKIIIAESGANDGLGYPFLFLGLYLLKYTHNGGLGQHGGAGKAMGLWFGDTWGYVIILSVVYGAVVGWIAKELLHWAEERRYVDRESFLVFAITLALFIVGTVGMIGSDDVLACFIAGNAFTWDDWFRLETMDDSLQPTIDMLLNVAIFIWFGAVCPWHQFVANDVIPIYRLIPLGILVLLFRRLPMVLAFHKKIGQVEDLRRALFVGFFGPIGVSAIFYLYVSREFLRTVTVDGVQRPDAQHLSEVLNIVVWFLVVCSIVVHGLSVPLGKLGLYLPRTISTAISSERVSRSSTRELHGDSQDPRLDQGTPGEQSQPDCLRQSQPTTTQSSAKQANQKSSVSFPGAFTKFLRKLRNDLRPQKKSEDQVDDERKDSPSDVSERVVNGDRHPEISAPQDPRIIGHPINTPPYRLNVQNFDARRPSPAASQSPVRSPPDSPVMKSGRLSPSSLRADSPGGSNTRINWQRSIRFPDEAPSTRTPPAMSPTGNLSAENIGEKN